MKVVDRRNLMWLENRYIIKKSPMRCKRLPRSPRSVRPSDALARSSKTGEADENQRSRDKRDTFSRTSRLRVVWEETEEQKTEELKGVACRRVFVRSVSASPIRLVVPLFFHSPSLLHARTLPISFSLYFRSSHSPPGYAIRGRAREIFASWNAANWPKINSHVEECYPFSLTFSLPPRFESLRYRNSLAPSVVIDRYTTNEIFSSNASHSIRTKYVI